MNKDYFDKNENECWKKLIQFNDAHRCFNSLARAAYSAEWDASGITKDGRPCIIELKARNAVITPQMTISGVNFNSSTIFLETYKHSALMMGHVIHKMTPLYINFLQDDTILVYNLLRITHFQDFHNLKVQSRGYGQMEMNARRYGLFLDDCAIYYKEGGENGQK